MSAGSWLSLEALGDDPSLPLRFLEVPGIPWVADSSHQSLPLSSTGLLLGVSLCVFSFLSFIMTPIIGYRVHPNSGWFYLEILTLITFAKTLTANKVTF